MSSFVFMISGLTGGEGGTIHRRGRDGKKHTLENFHLERASLPRYFPSMKAFLQNSLAFYEELFPPFPLGFRHTG